MSSLALRDVPLLRNRPFRAYWAGQTVSFVGDQISLLALPLVGVLTLDASAAQMGILTALGWAPHLFSRCSRARGSTRASAAGRS